MRIRLSLILCSALAGAVLLSSCARPSGTQVTLRFTGKARSAPVAARAAVEKKRGSRAAAAAARSDFDCPVDLSVDVWTEDSTEPVVGYWLDGVHVPDPTNAFGGTLANIEGTGNFGFDGELVIPDQILGLPPGDVYLQVYGSIPGDCAGLEEAYPIGGLVGPITIPGDEVIEVPVSILSSGYAAFQADTLDIDLAADAGDFRVAILDTSAASTPLTSAVDCSSLDGAMDLWEETWGADEEYRIGGYPQTDVTFRNGVSSPTAVQKEDRIQIVGLQPGRTYWASIWGLTGCTTTDTAIFWIYMPPVIDTTAEVTMVCEEWDFPGGYIEYVCAPGA